jgi:hypothetical protein
MTQERITMIKEGLAILKPLEIEIEDEGHLTCRSCWCKIRRSF